MAKEKEDIEFDDLLAEKRHKEVASALKGIATLLNKPQDNGVVDAIKDSTKATAGLIEAVKSIPKPEKPEVNIEFSPKEIVSSLQVICDKIVASNEKVIAALENRELVDEFKLQQDQWGTTKTIKVIYKKASEIAYPKTKYQA